MSKCNFGRFKAKLDTHKKGSSSYKMHDQKKLVQQFAVKPGEVLLDLGCGPGDYALSLSSAVGESGKIIAIDHNKEIIDYLDQRLIDSNITNIETCVANIKQVLPLESNSVDCCLMVTVLHTLNIKNTGEQIFNEIKRVLKPDGRLITIDVKKQDYDFGPPTKMKIAPQELQAIAAKAGLIKEQMVDLSFNYMLKFRPQLA